jgi:hypothetical protein
MPYLEQCVIKTDCFGWSFQIYSILLSKKDLLSALKVDHTNFLHMGIYISEQIYSKVS